MCGHHIRRARRGRRSQQNKLFQLQPDQLRRGVHLFVVTKCRTRGHHPTYPPHNRVTGLPGYRVRVLDGIDIPCHTISPFHVFLPISTCIPHWSSTTGRLDGASSTMIKMSTAFLASSVIYSIFGVGNSLDQRLIGCIYAVSRIPYTRGFHDQSDINHNSILSI